MLGNHITWSFHVPGTLAANILIEYTIPFDCIIKHISAVASNDSDATIIVGDDGDDNELLASNTVGDSGTPAEFDRNDWATTNPTGRYEKGKIMSILVDFDGAAGTAAANLTVVVTALEG